MMPNTCKLLVGVGVTSQSLRRGPKRPPLCPPRPDDEDLGAMVEASYSTMAVKSVLVADTLRSLGLLDA